MNASVIKDLTNYFVVPLTLMLSIVLVSSAATAPSPSQIAQFKRMSPAQQEAMAKQFGVEIPKGMSGAASEDAGEMQNRPLTQDRLLELEEKMLEEKARKKIAALDEEEPELERFGSYLFDRELETYAPVETALVPSGYQMGPGDVLNIQVFGKDSFEAELTVDLEGRLVVPRIGSVLLTGLTYNEAKELIKERVKQRMLGSSAVVSMGALKKISIFLAGEVKAPGNYNVSALTKVSQGLYLSGGITDIGSYRDIQVKREGELVAKFDVYDLLLQGDARGDIVLRSGDVLFVPPAASMVTISGEVQRPGIYDVKKGDTFETLLQMAGGASSAAYLSQTTLTRSDINKGFRELINITPAKFDLALKDGDQVVVMAASEQASNTIEIEGLAARPGLYQFVPGARVSSFFSNIERDLKKEADLAIGLIVRRRDQQFNIDIVPFDINAAVSAPGTSFDPELQAFDRLVVLPKLNITQKLEEEAERAVEEEEAGEDSYASRRREERALADYQKSSNSAEGVDNAMASEITGQEPTGPRPEVEEALEEDTVTREELLAPILEKIRQQAGSGEPLAIVTINGAVQEPGDYPLLAGGDLSYLAKLAGGLKDGAYLREVEVRRINVLTDDSVETEIIKTNLTAADAGFRLQSRDLVRVNFLPDWNVNETVLLEGELVFPGEYTLRDGETLRTLIDRAGGFTDEAFVEALRFTSEATMALQRESARSLIRRYRRDQASRSSTGEEVNREDREDFIDVIMDSFQGRLTVDMPRLLAGDESADVMLQAGDKISVPRRVDTVTVAGEVYEPGTFGYNPDRDTTAYIALAAGFTDRALEKNMYVILPNGEVRPFGKKRDGLFKFTKAQVELTPGSVIVVPTNYDYEKPLVRYRAITSVVFESVGSLAAFLSIKRN